jgi:hypothetical protein
MCHQKMLPNILHAHHMDTVSSFSIRNYVVDIFDQLSYMTVLDISHIK